MYKMHADLTSSVREGLREVPEEDLEKLIGGAMQLMKPPEGAGEDITLPVSSLQQFALFAAQCLSRQLLERQKQ